MMLQETPSVNWPPLELFFKTIHAIINSKFPFDDLVRFNECCVYFCNSNDAVIYCMARARVIIKDPYTTGRPLFYYWISMPEFFH